MLSLKGLTMPSSFVLDKLDEEDKMAVVFLNDAHNLARTEAIFAEELYHKMAMTAENYRMHALTVGSGQTRTRYGAPLKPSIPIIDLEQPDDFEVCCQLNVI